MRIYPIIFLLFSWLFSACTTAVDFKREKGRSQGVKAVVDEIIPQAYRLKGENIEVVLVGTFHSNNSEVIEIAQKLESEVITSDVLLLELNHDEAVNANIGRFYYGRGGRLSRRLSPEAFGYYNDRLKGRLSGSIERLSPMTVYILSVLPDDAFSEKGPVMDDYFGKVARENTVPILGLESFEEQMMSLYDLSEATVIRILEYQAQHPDSSSDELLAIRRAYIEGDLDRVYTFSKEIPAELPASHRLAVKVYLDQLIEGRNRLMWHRISQLVDSGRYRKILVAVGAAHLMGDYGILRLAQEADYEVSPYNPGEY